MTLIPWKSKQRAGDLAEASPITMLRSEMDRLFDTFVREPFGAMERFVGQDRWLPAIDVTETDKAVVVYAELPGVDPQNLEVTILGDRLFVTGVKQHSAEKRSKGYYRSEIRSGAFRRSVQLPEGIDPDQIEAHYANGMLTVTLKKSSSNVPKRVEVKVKEQGGNVSCP
jgi:HSP20 family protein